MKKRFFLLIALLSCSFSGCEKVFMDSDPDDYSYGDIYDALWKLVDEKYSYLEYKDIDWDEIYDKYRIMEGPGPTTAFQMYKQLSNMLYELQDGHVNLFAGFDYSRNWEWFLGAPANFNWPVVERYYLGDDYWISGGLKSTKLDGGKYGYIYYSSFSSSIGYMDQILKRFQTTRGLIIDLRDNGGGSLGNAELLADYIADTRRLTYRMRYKNGPGHNDFSDFKDHYSEPKGIGYTNPIIILTNRQCYSATSFFVTMAKEFPNVIVLGDTTGGGAGLPVDYILPGGWRVRLSTTRGTDARGVDFERGVEPDEKCDQDTALLLTGVDSMIERAKELIDNYRKGL